MPDRQTSIHICITCRNIACRNIPCPDPGEASVAGERPGARLYRALREAAARRDAPVELIPVECLSVCKRPCTIGFSGAGKWTYVYGDFAPDEASAEAILDAAMLYAATPDGLIPWRQRPDALKKGVVARIPPLIPHPIPDLPEAAE
jgi:predicted metal-binding protein